MMDRSQIVKCFDKFGEELQEGDYVDVQTSGKHKIYKKDISNVELLSQLQELIKKSTLENMPQILPYVVSCTVPSCNGNTPQQIISSIANRD